MSLCVRKPVFWVSDQVKPVCPATETSWRIETNYGTSVVRPNKKNKCVSRNGSENCR